VDPRQKEIQTLEQDWAKNPRWNSVQRGYTAAVVVRLRGSLKFEHTLA
jgi:isocitrate lyase